MKTWVVMNDIQLPFADRRALALALDIVRDVKPHGIVLNGDIVDCYALSTYDKNPATRATVQKEIAEARKLMTALERVEEKWWLGGNHESRLTRYIWQHPELASVDDLRFPSLFHLADHGFQWKPYGQGKMLGKLLVTHGFIVRSVSGASARAHFDRLGTSVLIGHTHRMAAYYRTNIRGAHVAYENGCLCRLDGLEYAQAPDWQHGLAIVHVEPKAGWFSVQQIPILARRTAFFGARRYEAA